MSSTCNRTIESISAGVPGEASTVLLSSSTEERNHLLEAIANRPWRPAKRPSRRPIAKIARRVETGGLTPALLDRLELNDRRFHEYGAGAAGRDRPCLIRSGNLIRDLDDVQWHRDAEGAHADRCDRDHLRIPPERHDRCGSDSA
jgi:hypothetical protein